MDKRATIWTALAFSAAPVLPALYGGLGTPVTTTIDTPIGLLSTDWLSVLVFAAIFYAASLPIVVGMGLPTFALLLKYNGIRWWSASLVGIFIGAFGSILISADRIIRTQTFRHDIHSIAAYAAVGAISGLLFWAIWRKGNRAAAQHIVRADAWG
jgi:hypothetical protein